MSHILIVLSQISGIIIIMYNLAEKEKMLNRHISGLLLGCREAVNAQYPGAQIVLYGSQTTGQAQPDSDIDLLVLLDEKVSIEIRKHIHDLLYDIALDKDVVISAIIKNAQEWSLPISQATGLYQEIQKEGIRLS